MLNPLIEDGLVLPVTLIATELENTDLAELDIKQITTHPTGLEYDPRAKLFRKYMV